MNHLSLLLLFNFHHSIAHYLFQVEILMASRTRLCELLQEKQEPFHLDTYLLENGCSVKRLQRIRSCGGGGGRRIAGGGFLRSILTKFVHRKVIQRALNWDGKSLESARLSVFDCFSEMGIKTNDGESDRFMETEDSEQLSPVSVLEFHNHRFREENQSSTSSLSSPRGTPAFPQSQREELLLDCRREAEGMVWNSHGHSGSENVVEKIIHEKILSWERLSGDATNLTQLLRSDVSELTEEWSHFRPEVREIGVQIESAIFEEIAHEIFFL